MRQIAESSGGHFEAIAEQVGEIVRTRGAGESMRQVCEGNGAVVTAVGEISAQSLAAARKC